MDGTDQRDGAPAGRPGRQVAVALGSGTHRPGSVPRVMASGRGEMAERLIQWAKDHDMAIEKNADLAQVLANLDMGDAVPEELFMAVAEVLYYVYEVNEAKAARGPG